MEVSHSWKGWFFSLLQRCASVSSSHRRTSTGYHVACVLNLSKTKKQWTIANICEKTRMQKQMKYMKKHGTGHWRDTGGATERGSRNSRTLILNAPLNTGNISRPQVRMHDTSVTHDTERETRYPGLSTTLSQPSIQHDQETCWKWTRNEHLGSLCWSSWA